MSVERTTILKSSVAADLAFDYKPKEFTKETAAAAVSYVHGEDQRKSDFRISEHAAHQSGVQKLEEEKSLGIINEQVLERLKEVQERAYKEAYDLGHMEGSEAGFQEQKNDMTAKIKTLDELIESVEKIKANLLRDSINQFVELTFEIGKRIALRDLSENKDAVVQLLQQVVGDLQSEQQIVIHCAPDDVAALEMLQKRTDLPIETLKRIKVIGDSTVEHGGCMIDLKNGQVNLRIPDRVQRIWDALEKQIQINSKS